MLCRVLTLFWSWTSNVLSLSWYTSVLIMSWSRLVLSWQQPELQMRPNDKESTVELVLCGSPVHEWRDMGGIKEAKVVLKSSAHWIKLELSHLLQHLTMFSLYNTKRFSFKSLTSHRKHEIFSVFAHYDVADRYLQVHVSSLIQLFKKKEALSGSSLILKV